MELTRRCALQSLALTLLAGAECLAIGTARWSVARAEDSAAFLQAVRKGDRATVQGMLKRQPTLASSTDAAGVSALIHAKLAGHEPIVELLL